MIFRADFALSAIEEAQPGSRSVTCMRRGLFVAESPARQDCGCLPTPSPSMARAPCDHRNRNAGLDNMSLQLSP